MHSLLTLTANILAEFTATYATDAPGQTHRAAAETFQVGGKGINVARMAQRLGVEATALYLAGGTLGDLCEEWLSARPFRSRRIQSLGTTRPGWVVRNEAGRETTFLGEDRPVSREDWETAVRQGAETDATAVALCGSIPGWTEDHGRVLADIWFKERKNNGTSYLDTYGPPLKSLSHLPWATIKINRDELAFLCPEPLSPETALQDILPRLAENSQAREWIITDGAGAISVFSKSEGYFELQPPVVEAFSPTGSGDVFLATYIHGRMEGKNLRESVGRAAAFSAANAAHPGVADFAFASVPQ